MNTDTLLAQTREGFKTLKVGDQFKNQALEAVEEWLTDDLYSDYRAQMEHLIEHEYWDYLLDSFYQVIPFGTGGRRGEVGVGPNRINPFTIMASAQGHSQYLVKMHGDEAKERGVVLAWDVRVFTGNKYLSDDIQNPVKMMTGDVLAKAAAGVYAANGIKVYMFDGIRTTPELSFAVRYLNAIAGDVFSASHNPPEHNGKKVYDRFGGQLVPPNDEALVDEVTRNVTEIQQTDLEKAKVDGLLEIVGPEVDEAYVKAAAEVSLSNARGIKIAFTPLHGCASTSVLKVLDKLGFDVEVDPRTGNPSGKFENVTFNIPNPEVIQSFDTPLKFAKEIKADILLNSDPDADRIGVMVKHGDDWIFMNGNEIASVLAAYVTMKRKSSLPGKGVMVKTAVTTNIIREICKKHDFDIHGELLVGFKYVGEIMNQMEEAGTIDNFLFGCEESHGYLAGNYARDKDASVAAVWLSELAAELKQEGRTLIDYLNEVYAEYGYFGNYLTEIRLPGAEGRGQIDSLQAKLRASAPSTFGRFLVEKVEDYLDQKPIVSETDRASKNVMAFHFQPVEGTISVKVTVRPSGTEPKIKMYFEIGSKPFDVENVDVVREQISDIISELERDFMMACYKMMGVDFPERGLMLFWQLPLQAKLRYFEIEDDIADLKKLENKGERKSQLDTMLAFLGADPVMKVDKAFKEKYGADIQSYLEL